MRKTWLNVTVGMHVTPQNCELDDLLYDLELGFCFRGQVADVIDHEIDCFDSKASDKVQGAQYVELVVKVLVYHDRGSLSELMKMMVCKAKASAEFPGAVTKVKIVNYEMEDSR